MKELAFESGLEEYRLGAGVLRFNPRDPNLYHRFLKAGETLRKLEKELSETAEKPQDGPETLALLAQADARAKAALDQVFPQNTPFEELLFGVSLFAGAENGRRVLENLLSALAPILEKGAKDFYEAEAEAALDEAARERKARQGL